MKSYFNKILILILFLNSSNLYSQNGKSTVLDTKMKIDSFIENRTEKSVNLIKRIEFIEDSYEKTTLFNNLSNDIYKIFINDYKQNSYIEYTFYYHNNNLILATVWKELKKDGLAINYFKQNSYYFNQLCIDTSNDKIETKELYETGMSYLKKDYYFKTN